MLYTLALFHVQFFFSFTPYFQLLCYDFELIIVANIYCILLTDRLYTQEFTCIFSIDLCSIQSQALVSLTDTMEFCFNPKIIFNFFLPFKLENTNTVSVKITPFYLVLQAYACTKEKQVDLVLVAIQWGAGKKVAVTIFGFIAVHSPLRTKIQSCTA